MNHCKADCKFLEYNGCGYASIAKGRKAVLTTVCDIYGIPYSRSDTEGIEALNKHGCPCYEPGQPKRQRPEPLAASRKRLGKYDWDRARELYEGGMNDPEIGKALGCSAPAVLSWRRREKLPSITARKKIDWARCFELYRQGKTDRQIAEALGANCKSIQKWRKAHSLDANNKRGVWK